MSLRGFTAVHFETKCLPFDTASGLLPLQMPWEIFGGWGHSALANTVG